MNIKLASQEDLTITTKGGHTVTVPDADGTLALEGGSGASAKFDSSAVAPDFDPTHEYTFFEPCTHDGQLYFRTAATPTGGDGSWIANNWYGMTVSAWIELVSNGNLYGFNDIEPSSSTINVSNHAINRIRTSESSVTLVPDMADTSHSTDFFCMFSGSASGTIDVSVSSGTVVIGNSNMTGVVRGDVLHFTDISTVSDTLQWMVIKYSGSTGIPTDSQLSPTSSNPIANSAVYAAIGDINSVLDAINGEVI